LIINTKDIENMKPSPWWIFDDFESNLMTFYLFESSTFLVKILHHLNSRDIPHVMITIHMVSQLWQFCCVIIYVWCHIHERYNFSCIQNNLHHKSQNLHKHVSIYSILQHVFIYIYISQKISLVLIHNKIKWNINFMYVL